MQPTVATPHPHCREFRGIERGWCPREQTVWIDNVGFCGQHAAERTLYNARRRAA